MFKPTQEQIEIVDAFSKNKIIKVNSIAGSGKTSTLLLLAAENVVPSLYLAFNKSVQLEAAEKFPGHVECRTINSLAYADFGIKLMHKMRANRPKTKHYVNTCSTLKEIVNFFKIDDYTLSDPPIPAKTVAGLVKDSLNRYQLSDIQTIGTEVIPIGEIKRLEKSHKFDSKHLALAIIGYARKLWNERINPKSDASVTHDTFLKLWSLSNPKLNCEILYVDEAQDTNPAVFHVLRQQKHCKICYVGDTYQSIYAFRGAINAMEEIKAPTYYLTQSWRYGEEVANAAQFVVGDAITVKGNPSTNSKVVDELPDSTKVTIIFRTNACLLDEAHRLLAEGIPVNIEIDIKVFIDKIRSIIALKNKDYKNVKNQEIAKFSSYYDLLEFSKEDHDTKMLIKRATSDDIEDFLLKISTSCSSETSDVILTTAHKSKGREWDNVIIYSDFKFNDDSYYPLKDMPQQEINLLYVAITRAKKNLVLPEQIANYKDL